MQIKQEYIFLIVGVAVFLLYGPPILSINGTTDWSDFPILPFYIFSVWALFIFGCYAINRKRS